MFVAGQKNMQKNSAWKPVSGGFRVGIPQVWVRFGLRAVLWWSCDLPRLPGSKEHWTLVLPEKLSAGVFRCVESVYERESGAEPMDGVHVNCPKCGRAEAVKIDCQKTVPLNRRTTKSCNNDHSLQFILMPLSPAKKTAPASSFCIFSGWLINSWLVNIERADDVVRGRKWYDNRAFELRKCDDVSFSSSRISTGEKRGTNLVAWLESQVRLAMWITG